MFLGQWTIHQEAGWTEYWVNHFGVLSFEKIAVRISQHNTPSTSLAYNQLGLA
jgi:hypothetical protein